jgi:chromosomal replication initiator protein
VDDSTYRLWLAPLRARQFAQGRMLIEAPAHCCGWIGERFGRILGASATVAVGGEVLVELVPTTSGDGDGHVRRAVLRPRGGPADGTAAGSSHDGRGSPSAPPANRLDNARLTFEQFVIGDCNRLAHAAALTVAEMPGQAYNPLFIYGPPGVGKTHLLGAIATLMLAHQPGLCVRWTTGEAFTNEFLGALAGGQTDTFKARFRDVDVLLLDDVQFLERKARTEEEFFHTFNALHDVGRQIVLTSDRTPRDLQALEDRLRERFQAGLVADVKPPELNTRLAILRKRVHDDRVELADEQVLDVLAQRVTHNVRALEGALVRVVAYSSLTDRPLTPALASEVLDGLYPASRAGQAIGVADIQAAACAHFGVTLEELLSNRRTQRLAWARQVAMYLARELTSESFPSIGRHFGGRDHTTVLHAWRRTGARLVNDPARRAVVERLCTELTACRSGRDGSPDRSS